MAGTMVLVELVLVLEWWALEAWVCLATNATCDLSLNLWHYLGPCSSLYSLQTCFLSILCEFMNYPKHSFCLN